MDLGLSVWVSGAGQHEARDCASCAQQRWSCLTTTAAAIASRCGVWRPCLSDSMRVAGGVEETVD